MINTEKFYSDSAITIGGEVISALTNFVTLALLARLLEPEMFGQLALAIAYTLSFDLLLNFQSWRIVIRYGANALDRQDLPELGRILKLSVFLDASSAIFAALLSVLFVKWIVPIVGGGDDRVFYIYSITILFNAVGHSTGILRLFGRFKFLSIQKVLAAIARLLAVLLVFSIGDGGLLPVTIALVGAECSLKMVLLLRGYLELNNQGLLQFFRSPVRGVRENYPDIVSFSIYSSLNDTVLKVVQQLDIFVVAFFLTPAAAGVYRVIKSLGSIGTMLASAIGQVIYPELARIYVSSRERLAPFLKRLWVGLSIIAAIGLGAYLLIADFLIAVIFGGDYSEFYIPSVIYMFGAALSIVCLPYTPLLLVKGKQRVLFVAYLIGSFAYIASLTLGVMQWGLIGGAAAFPILYVFYFLVVWRYS